MHINDSKSKLGGRLDRHDSIGHGELGWEFFRRLMQDPRFDDIPLVLETIDESLWKQEIAALQALSRCRSRPEGWEKEERGQERTFSEKGSPSCVSRAENLLLPAFPLSRQRSFPASSCSAGHERPLFLGAPEKRNARMYCSECSIR